MNERSNEALSADTQTGNSEIVAMLKKMQEQIAFLERKIDSLIDKKSSKSFNREKSPARTLRSAERALKYGRGPSYHASGEKSFGNKHSFNKRRGEETPEIGNKKKFYDGFDANSSGKRYGSKPKKSFDPKKKPFFKKH